MENDTKQLWIAIIAVGLLFGFFFRKQACADEPIPLSYLPGHIFANCNIKGRDCTEWRVIWKTEDDVFTRHEVMLPTPKPCTGNNDVYEFVPPGAIYWIELRDKSGTGDCGPKDWTPSSGPFRVSSDIVNGQVVPEPCTSLLLVAGLVGLVILRRFRHVS